MFKPRILLVTSKWSAEDHDGGMTTALDICDTISPYCHLDVLAPSAYITHRREGVKNVFPFLNNEFGENDVDKIVKFFENLAGAYLINKLGCIAFGIKAIETNS